MHCKFNIHQAHTDKVQGYQTSSASSQKQDDGFIEEMKMSMSSSQSQNVIVQCKFLGPAVESAPVAYGTGFFP